MFRTLKRRSEASIDGCVVGVSDEKGRRNIRCASLLINAALLTPLSLTSSSAAIAAAFGLRVRVPLLVASGQPE